MDRRLFVWPSGSMPKQKSIRLAKKGDGIKPFSKYLAHEHGWFAKGMGPSPPYPTADNIIGLVKELIHL
jgi:hypothetical protein